MIYLDNAATTNKKPKEVINAVNNALKNFSVNPGRAGYELSIKAAEKIYFTRVKIKELFNCNSAENVVFTYNCTHAINYCLKGALKRGDHIIISNLEHNAVARPVYSLHKDGKIEFDVFDAFADDVVTEIKNRIKPNTKMIFCTHASNVCGKLLPIKEIGTLAKEHNILFGVDGAQTAGVLDIDMKEMNIDFLCLAGHKGLYSPMGVGVLLKNGDIAKTVMQGGTGTNSMYLEEPLESPERFESGTVNLPGILGLSAGVDFVRKIGVQNIYYHELKLINQLLNGIKNTKNITVYKGSQNFAPVISLTLNGLDSVSFGQLLEENGIAVRSGLHCAPIAHKTLGTLNGGTVRISVGFFNNYNEILKAVKVIKEIS